MRSSFLLCAGIFFLLFMFFFPLDFLGEFQYKTSLFLWGDFTAWITENLFKTKHSRTDFSSDSISMVVLSIILLLISIIAALIIKQKYHKKILYHSGEITILYLAVVLMKYGFDKIFKAQFYLPEPNILYSRFGNLDKDILFWSTMGTSRLYSVSAGILELLAALLILFHKTRTAGLLISIGILINIFLINIEFDISVKLFSLILFFMAVFALKDDCMPIFRFLILKKEPKFEDRREAESKFHPVWIFFKTAFVGLSMAVILFPLMNSGNFNDDKADRPFLHGAFKNLDTDSDIQYIFFHRSSYIILMDKSEKMVDFHYTQSSNNQLILEDYANKKTEVDYVYQKKDSLLTLNFGKYMVRTKELNWRKMNALKPLFHVTIEDME